MSAGRRCPVPRLPAHLGSASSVPPRTSAALRPALRSSGDTTPQELPHAADHRPAGTIRRAHLRSCVHGAAGTRSRAGPHTSATHHPAFRHLCGAPRDPALLDGHDSSRTVSRSRPPPRGNDPPRAFEELCPPRGGDGLWLRRTPPPRRGRARERRATRAWRAMRRRRGGRGPSGRGCPPRGCAGSCSPARRRPGRGDGRPPVDRRRNDARGCRIR